VDNTAASVCPPRRSVELWAISNGVCTPSTDDVQITYDAAPTLANAGLDQNVCALVATLAGNTPVIGSGTWSKFSRPGTVTFGNDSGNAHTSTPGTLRTHE